MKITPITKSRLKRALTLGLLTMTLSATIGQADVAIISHPNLKMPALNQQQVRQLFLNKSTDYAKLQKMAILNNKSEANKVFFKKVVKMSDSKFRSFWSTQVFTGKGSAPVYLATDGEVLEFVANTQGAIGFVDADTVGKEVSTILVIPSK